MVVINLAHFKKSLEIATEKSLSYILIWNTIDNEESSSKPSPMSNSKIIKI